MRVRLVSTPIQMELNGQPVRVWTGTTKGGLFVHFLVAAVMVDEAETGNPELAELVPMENPSLIPLEEER